MLQKQPVPINFIKGLDTKTDPYQVPIGNFLDLNNMVFTTTGRMTKRNGYGNITKLPVTTQTTLCTLNDSLIATGANLYNYSEDINVWINQGISQPVQLTTQALTRTSTSQTSPDSAMASTGLICLVYMDGGQSYYQVSDSSTGQQVVHRTQLPTGAKNPRAVILASYFIITFTITITATPHLQYIAISTNDPTVVSPATDISSAVASDTAGYDCVSSGNFMFIAFNGSGTTVKLTAMSNSFAISPPVTVDTKNASLISVTIDPNHAYVWVSYWDSGSTNGYSAAYNFLLGAIVTPTQIITTTSIAELTSVVQNSILSVFYEVINNYSFQNNGSNIRSDYINSLTVTLPVGVGPGTVSSTSTILRSAGLASKAFITSGNAIYMIAVYGDVNQINSLDNSNQPTYFLIDSLGNIYMRLAYANGGGYEVSQVLPSVNELDGIYNVPYLTADFLAAVNKGTNNASGTPTNAIYTQYGVNLASFSINSNNQTVSEIANALHLTGGQLWEYDGVKPVEHGFQVWPENINLTTSASGGVIGAGTYFYQVTYEWTDGAGNLQRSAPSIPVTIVTTGSTSSNTLKIPTLRLTYKNSSNPVRIVIYRWSVAQQVYYQITSITSPLLNDPTTDSVTYVDTKSDAQILGNTILYTTGGVLENIAAPPSVASTLFSNRLWLIDAEDPNLLWYSKQVIENVPVEMSDLLTIYIAPTTGAQASTGPSKALAPMDDKLIIFKKDAIYYISGSGPDNTGANNNFTDPVFITSTVGCDNPNSIVLMKDGLMFQSDKGIWLLSRSLDTLYIGFPVEKYNGNTVKSATAVPGTNQVRFVLDNNVTLMYDYFVQQWGTHSNINAISATLWEGAHTYLNIYGQIFKETPGMYLDGSVPVLMGLTTSWINVAGLQGFQRFYEAYLLGTYFSPFKLNVSFAYNYNPSPVQSTLVVPDNQTKVWGGEELWGSGGSFGSDSTPRDEMGQANLFTARLFPKIQQCQSFQMSIQEVYDPSFGQTAGQGLSLSGLLLLIGVKKGSRTQSARNSFG